MLYSRDQGVQSLKFCDHGVQTSKFSDNETGKIKRASFLAHTGVERTFLIAGYQTDLWAIPTPVFICIAKLQNKHLLRSKLPIFNHIIEFKLNDVSIPSNGSFFDGSQGYWLAQNSSSDLLELLLV